MISLQSHNQVLYHLTQLTTTVTPRSTSIAARAKRRDGAAHKEKVLCKDSFEEAAKNCTELLLDGVRVQQLAAPLRVGNKDTWDILLRLSKEELPVTINRKNKWNISYISASSFNENKRGVLLAQSKLNIPPVISLNIPQHRLIHNLCRYSRQYGYQIRHFKTDRSIEADLERNPTLGSRFKKWLGFASQNDEKAALSAAAREHADVDKLKKILNNKDISATEVQHIKVAFAEGYIAGHSYKPRGKTMKALRVMQQILSTALIFLIIIGLMATAGGSMFKIQLGSQVEVDPEEIHITFNDVKGVDEAKHELMDVVEFLKNPDKFSALGGKLPKGVLLVGPPGTGKTLLARAVAGEAGVPFFHAAGPEFDEILVGQGARRVRELFKAAKERAPCVIFIDEIDSVGAKRTNSALHPYANQTINQLLSEMDGFHQNEGVIVLGATNRQQDLDKALLRPGRFDLEIFVNAPDYSGRKEILDLYLGRILTRDVDAKLLARCTTGFTGADIENMVNQAALKAAIEGAEYVTMEHLERARDKVLMGPEGKRKMMDEEENRITAYHEGGHALVAYYTKEATPLHKVTIIPRGQSLGHTSYLPKKDVHHVTKAQMLATMDACMGGRAAEELMFGSDKVTSGASSDFVNATQIAEDMVKRLGMSEKVGFRAHRDSSRQISNSGSTYSPSTNELIDNEVKRLLQESYDRAKNILKTHVKELKLLADALMIYETLDSDEVKAIINGKVVRNETPSATENTKRTIIDVPNNVL